MRRGLGAVECDPFWTQQSGYCSDEFGNFIDQMGSPMSPTTVSYVRPPAAAPAPAPSATPAGGEESPELLRDPLGWIGHGYNAVYVALGVVAIVAVFKATGGRR